MTIALGAVSAASRAASGTAALAVNVPTGVANGSLVIAVTQRGYSGNVKPDQTWLTPPTGFTVNHVDYEYDSAANYTFAIFWAYHYATAADTGTYTFTSSTGTLTSGRGYAFIVTGGPTSGNPFSYFQASSVATATTSALTVPSITPRQSNTVLFGAYFANVNSTVTGPAGWNTDINYDDTASGVVLGGFDYFDASMTATGTLSFTPGASATSQLASVVGLANQPVPSVTGAPVVQSTGTVGTGNDSAASVSAGVPSGVQAGDLIVAAVEEYIYTAGGTPDSSFMTAPSGWGLASFNYYADSIAGGSFALWYFYKVASSADTGSYAFTKKSTVNSGYVKAVATRITGAGTPTTYGLGSIVGGLASSSYLPATTLSSASLLLAWHFTNYQSLSMASGGWSQLTSMQDATGGVAVDLWDAAWSGSAPAMAFTPYTNASSNGVLGLIIPAAAAVAPAGVNLSSATTNILSISFQSWLTNSATLQIYSGTKPVTAGSASGTLLASIPLTCTSATGGSITWSATPLVYPTSAGTAGYARLYDAVETATVLDCDISTIGGSGQIQLPVTTFDTGTAITMGTVTLHFGS